MATFTSNGTPITQPSPQYDLPIVSNNGVLKLSPNLFDKNDSGIGDGYISASTGAVTGTTRGHTGYFKVKPNITYHVTLDARQSGSANGIAFYDNDKQFVVGLTSNSSYGNPPYNFTVPDNNSIVYARLTLTNNIASTNLNEIQIEKGSTGTPIIPYGAIYTDGTVETVEVTGKNLVDSSFMDRSSYESLTIYGESTDYAKILPVQNGQTYTLSATITVTASGTYYYYMKKITPDGNSQLIRMWYGSTDANRQYTFTASDNATYLVFYASGTNMTLTNYQLELGSTATAYEPYYYGGSATAEMLLKIGDYKDEQNVTSGAITRNVGIKVLDGSEQWSYYSVQQGNMFRTTISDSASNGKDVLGVLCNCYAVIGTGQRTNNTLSGTSKNYDFINNNYTNLTDWTAYLAQQYANGTPIIIAYPLEEPTAETVTPQALSIQAGTNIVEITQASIDNLGLEVSYKGTI